MSRIGAKPIQIPNEVTVVIQNNVITCYQKAKNISDFFLCPDGIGAVILENQIFIKPIDEKQISQTIKSLWGTTRARVNNMIVGLAEGFEIVLELSGVGYKAMMRDEKTLVMKVGHSHEDIFISPDAVKIICEKNNIVLKSYDNVLLGNTAHIIINKAPINSYSGKGIKKKGTVVVLKEIKKKKTTK